MRPIRVLWNATIPKTARVGLTEIQQDPEAADKGSLLGIATANRNLPEIFLLAK